MTIQATRFKVLDKQTKLGVSDFLAIKDSGILNSPDADFKTIDQITQELIANTVQQVEITPPSIVDTAIRSAKDGLSAIVDIGKYSSKDLDKMIGSLVGGNSLAQNLFGKLSPGCSKNSLSSGKFGKPFKNKVDCGGKTRLGKGSACKTSDISDVLGKATNGLFSATGTDLNAALQKIIGLSKLGYDANFCGTFTSLAVGVEKSVTSKASGVLLSHLGNTSNLLGVFDLANSSAGLSPLIESPGGIKSVFNNLKPSAEILQKNFSNTSDRLTGSMEMFKPDWNKSSLDGMLSTSFSGVYNSTVDSYFKAKQLSTTVNPSQLDNIVTDDHAFMSTAYTLGNPALGLLT